MDVFTAAIAIFVISLLLFLTWTISSYKKDARNSRRGSNSRKAGATGHKTKPCPLCGELLYPGENVKTVVFSGTKHKGLQVEESMAHIMGCPNCYPSNRQNARLCPACKKELSSDGYVVARYFMRQGKKHIHVIGCTECRRVR